MKHLLISLFIVYLSLFPLTAKAADDVRVVKILQELIRADTTNPPGSELRAVLVLEKWLRQEPSIQLERVESIPGRSSLIARLPGKGSKPALILMGHLDVVTANPQEWSLPPFSGVIKDGHVWGRGALDMKGMLAMETETLLRLAADKSPLEGDVILVAAADEEAGGRMGMNWLVKHRPELLRAGWVLNEGSIGVRHKIFDIFPIQVAEKGVCWLKVTAKGRAGHGSMPDSDNAVLKLVRAMDKVGRYKFPLEGTSVTREFLAAISKKFSFPESFVLKNLFSPGLGRLLLPLSAKTISQHRTLHAILSHTAAPTRLQAGTKTNVIPDSAEGYIDARILPGTTPKKFRDFLQNLLGNDIHLEIVTSSLPNESPRDTPFYKTLVKVLKKHYPEAVVAPILSAGATDSRFFRYKGVPAYGLIPVLIEEADLDGVHGKNERIPIKGLKTGVTILMEVIHEVL